MLQAVTGGALAAAPIPWLGLSGPEAACFAAFWALQASRGAARAGARGRGRTLRHAAASEAARAGPAARPPDPPPPRPPKVAIITRGIGSIKAVEKYSAPVLVALALALLAWAVATAGGLGPMLSAPSRLATPAQFWGAFLPSLTAQVGYWATLALNVSDFSRWVCLCVWGGCGGCGGAVSSDEVCGVWSAASRSAAPGQRPVPPQSWPPFSPAAGTPPRSARSCWARRGVCRRRWPRSRGSASR
jgi:hypothetical protein